MRLQDYDQDSKTGAIGYMLMGVAIFIVVIILLVLILNDSENKKNDTVDKKVFKTEADLIQEQAEAEYADKTKTDQLDAAQKDLDDLLSGNQFTSDDLDFWDMYPIDEEESQTIEGEEGKLNESETAEDQEDKAVLEEDEIVENDPSFGGKYTLVKRSDNTEEWILVQSYLSKHNYNFEGLLEEDGYYAYYENDKKISKLGVDLSKYQGSVNFSKVKKAGFDFVMLRAGARGYGSGKIIEDSFFDENLIEASNAGLQIGIYFYSQAISKEEAEEEANFVLSQIGTTTITYPIVFDMEEVMGDTYRTQSLTKEKRTEIAAAFLNVIKTAGYTPMLYGTKEWLLEKYQLATLTSTDIWLAQYETQPDYPYTFNIWQYTQDGTVPGISGKVDINLCFIDYELK